MLRRRLCGDCRRQAAESQERPADFVRNCGHSELGKVALPFGLSAVVRSPGHDGGTGLLHSDSARLNPSFRLKVSIQAVTPIGLTAKSRYALTLPPYHRPQSRAPPIIMPAQLNTGIAAAVCFGMALLQCRALAAAETVNQGLPPKLRTAASMEFRASPSPSESASRSAGLIPGDHLAAGTPGGASAIPTWTEEMAARYEADRVRQQLDEALWTAERQSYQLQQRELQLQQLWGLIGAIGLMLVLAGTWLYRLRRALLLAQRAESQAQRSQRELQALNVSLEQRLKTRTEGLGRQTSFLQTLIDYLPSQIWLEDPSGRAIAVNRAYTEASGRSAMELLGSPVDDSLLRTAGNPETVADSDPDPIAGSCRETVRVPVRNADNGLLLGTVGICYDVSARKAAEDAREHALSEAVRLAHLRSEFLGQMSHELRTPLNSILGYAQLMQRDPVTDERHHSGLEAIRQGGLQLLTAINDMLDFARIEAGKPEMAPGEVMLRPLLDGIAATIGIRAREKGLTFKLELPADLPERVWADPQRLRQILLNLLDNAVKFTSHGDVVLRAMPAGAERVRFEIHDTGCGIAPPIQARIFQPFEHVGEPRPQAGGIGLGLALSRRYVRLMGGDIGLESRIGHGSTFYFEIQIGRLPQPGAACPQQAQSDAREPLGEPVEAAMPNPTLPPANAERLLELARLGCMGELIAWADQLERLEPETFRSTADQVRRLAAEYESQQLLQLAQRCAAAACVP
ncbi:MAG: hypothetical protein FIA97_10455 [Methylococcaceae bacterium]|nr:hypothetical protein [Methylococcaceae bacterium]